MELAAAAGVSQSAISQFESGIGITDPDLAATVAVALDTSAALLGERPPAPRILHHLPRSLPRASANRALASLTMTHARLALLMAPPAVTLRRSPGSVDWSHPHDLAERVRWEWNLLPGAASKLVPTLEAHGIVCIYRDLGDVRTHALSSTAQDRGVVMLLDSGATRRELAWAIAHELGHLVFGDEPSKAGESAADEFAIEFLAPGRELLEMRISTAEDLAAAATKFGVSPRALLRRLRELGRISARGQRELARNLGQFPQAELPNRFIGSPTLLATAVRELGGSAVAASHAYTSVGQLRTDYLARSGT